jgi:hypothetical protein
MKPIPHPNILIGNIYLARGTNGKLWLIMNEDPKGQYTGEGLELDEAAMTELKDFLNQFFRKHIAEATWPEEQKS